MKSKIEGNAPDRRRLPAIYRCIQNGAVVLFDSPTTGTCLANPGPCSQVGRFDDDWVSCYNKYTWERFDPGERFVMQND